MAWAWAAERDDLRQEVRKDEGGTVTFWPKVDGANVAVSDSAGECTVALYKPDGTVLRASENLSHTAEGDYDYFAVAVTAAEAAGLDEGYQARISWRKTGTTLDILDVVQFDVVSHPWWQTVSLNDFMGLFSGAGEVLDRIGVELGETTGDNAKLAASAQVGWIARVELDTWVRARIAADVKGPTHTYTGVIRAGAVASRPSLILNRTALTRVEKALAMCHMFEQNGGTDEGSDQASQLMRTWRARAEHAWGAVPAFEYDTDDDLIVDDIVSKPGRTIRTRRR